MPNTLYEAYIVMAKIHVHEDMVQNYQTKQVQISYFKNLYFKGDCVEEKNTTEGKNITAI